jgi:hypothetical protein
MVRARATSSRHRPSQSRPVWVGAPRGGPTQQSVPQGRSARFVRPHVGHGLHGCATAHTTFICAQALHVHASPTSVAKPLGRLGSDHAHSAPPHVGTPASCGCHEQKQQRCGGGPSQVYIAVGFASVTGGGPEIRVVGNRSGNDISLLPVQGASYLCIHAEPWSTPSSRRRCFRSRRQVRHPRSPRAGIYVFPGVYGWPRRHSALRSSKTFHPQHSATEGDLEGRVPRCRRALEKPRHREDSHLSDQVIVRYVQSPQTRTCCERRGQVVRPPGSEKQLDVGLLGCELQIARTPYRGVCRNFEAGPGPNMPVKKCVTWTG